MYQRLGQAVAERERIALATVVATAKGQEDLLGRKLLITGSGIYGDLGDAALMARMRAQAAEFLLQREAQLVGDLAGAGAGRPAFSWSPCIRSPAYWCWAAGISPSRWWRSPHCWSMRSR